ncbi:hypothetical protein HF086_013074 [Spodoptera exigua]|uniref:MBD domain-containing protein n=1 Tax=Spodoptera exigua TaxID=7107 RepID=A0A922SNX2_SPOEX|nr:hypothetical protein HF086_013074 [Spodoptera exigua]
MSEEMAVSDNTTGDEAKVSNDEQTAAPVAEPEEVATGAPSEPVAPVVEVPPMMEEDAPEPEIEPKNDEKEEKPEVKMEPLTEEVDLPLDSVHTEVDLKKEELDDVKDEFETFEHNIEEDIKRGIKRRASSAFSDNGDEDFKGFDDIKIEVKTEDYSRVLERLEAEVTEASKDLVPIRTVMAAPARASKRPRKDTDGSRPSSALSSRSDEGGTTDVSAASSPAHRGGRRSTIEMSSPLLRVPLERGWKRELVYRAALDAHSRRNADIYYYTPYGKKLRSTREVAEHLAGTGLTVENFSFFKEPLGVDDPEKEIISAWIPSRTLKERLLKSLSTFDLYRDAKLIRRVDSPIAATVPPTQVEGKRTPKPKAPKGASPEPVTPASTATTTTSAGAANKSPPAKLKVKSMGSRLSNTAAPATPTPPAKQQKKPQPAEQKPQPAQQPATTPSNTDNNNTAAWKKPSMCMQAESGRVVQPCSMSCGRGAVPSLACAACLCLYHPVCVGYTHAQPPDPFLCKNCRKSTSPPPRGDPPPLTHKSGITTSSLPIPVPVPVPVPVLAPVPRRVPVPVPIPVPAKVPRDKRVLLRMKVAGGTPDGERVWAVAGAGPGPMQAAAAPGPVAAPPAAAPAATPPPAVPPALASRAHAPHAALPQSLAVLNGRRFVVVPRSMVQPAAK